MSTPRTILTLIALVLAGLVPATAGLVPAAAQSNAPALVIETGTGQPTNALALTIEPGKRASLDFRFSVNASEPIDVTTSLANVVSPPNGGFSLAPPEAAPAAWVTYAPETLTLEPGTDTRRTLQIAVPAATKPGQYVAAIAIQTADPIPVPGSESVGQITRTIAAITITVPGKVQGSFTLGEPAIVQQRQGTVIQIPIQNTGTVPISPQGTLTLHSPAGDEIAGLPVAMGTVFANTGTILEIPLAESPPPGDYEITLQLADTNTRATAKIDARTLLFPEPEMSSTDPEPYAGPDPNPLITFERVVIEADGVPMESVFFAVDVANVGQPVAGATLTLEVSRNGQLVESAVIATDVSVVDGTISISSRFTPQTGFSSGLWTFRIRLDAIDDSGNATLLAHSGTIAKIDVP